MSLAGKEVRIGRWSEQREVTVSQFRTVERWAEQSVRSGEVREPWDGRQVGVSLLRKQRLLLLMASVGLLLGMLDAVAMSEMGSTRLGGGH